MNEQMKRYKRIGFFLYDKGVPHEKHFDIISKIFRSKFE